MKESLREFYNLLEDEWENRMHINPLFATYTGDHRFDDKLPRVREQDFTQRSNQLKVFYDRLNSINKEDFLSSDLLNYNIFTYYLENELSSLKFHRYRFPLSKVGGLHLEFPELFLRMSMKTQRDYQNYISRLKGFPLFVEDHIEIMRTGLKEGQIPPKVTMVGVVESIHNQIVNDPEKSRLYEPFKQIPKGLSSTDREELLNTGINAINNFIIPGFRKLSYFLENEYIKQSRDSLAASNLPDGKNYYQFCIKYYTTLDINPETIHKKGLEEVQRIKNEMKNLIDKAEFKGSIKEFTQNMRNDSRFYVDKPETLLEKTALILKRMDGELPKLFKTLPRLPYGIRPIPDYAAPGNTTAYYYPGTGDGTQSGTYYVNTYDLKSRPLYELEALSFHEAVPGHHLQIALQQELDLPNFRRFSRFTAFVEGWGLYSERLGLETGFYTDIYSNFNRLSYEMWRACRLVVDTGIHALEWSRQRAIDFLAENTSLSLLNITNEVDRYICWPGQALAYKLGEIKISELRQLVEKKLKENFDVREFHNEILKNGAIPLEILENIMNEWIEKHEI